MFTSFFERYYAELDSFMRQVVASVPEQPPELGIMIQYAMGWVDANGSPVKHQAGKRIRPMLLLLAAESSGGDWHAALPAAAAVELLHNFSLIHDDIQDDSPTRHSRPTVWKIWGRAHAINAGDALFTMAFSALQQLSRIGVADSTVVKAWAVFNHTALELTRGQYLDMHFERQSEVTVDEYLSMIRGKSAALIAASARLGALIASNSESLAQCYATFGLNLGMAFQIRDDILGIWGDPAVTGKSAATDIISRKKSLPVLYGLSQSSALAAVYQHDTFTSDDISEAIGLLNSVDAQAYTAKMEDGYYQEAFKALEEANPQGQASKGLAELAQNLFQRQV